MIGRVEDEGLGEEDEGLSEENEELGLKRVMDKN